ncbi:calcium calmodulin-dependent protein kinase [Ophiostoma piceae UAMH 11346]|uniref:Calcium calmodulin-dependent protein kinase n=1 Tax=Ophiostoma piceae (strain UAMH 11346) TaxID=1262450 RepID=S3C3L1_OPHP1|nr:calcium calmodulin-dependent protein kinase [Ophiostoma piceae UAMH 11346]
MTLTQSPKLPYSTGRDYTTTMMSAPGDTLTRVFYLQPENDVGHVILEKKSKSLVNINKTLSFPIGFSYPDTGPTHTTKKHLAQIGTDPSSDIVLPEEYANLECLFDVNSHTGVVLLHAKCPPQSPSTDQKATPHQTIRKVIQPKRLLPVGEDDDPADEVTVHSGMDWALSFHRPATDNKKIAYLLKIRSAQFRILQDPSFDLCSEASTYLKKTFGSLTLSDHGNAVFKDKITSLSLGLLGEGAQGKVERVVSSLNGYIFARKKINVEALTQVRNIPPGQTYKDILLKEKEIVNKICKDPDCHVVDYLYLEGLNHDTTASNSDDSSVRYVYVYMEVFDGSFADLVKREEFKDLGARLQLVMHMVEQISKVLCHLAEVNTKVIYRDVKPGNILYRKTSPRGDCPYHFYLTDFGLAKNTDENATILGTEAYAAPEAHPSRTHDEERPAHTIKMDIFSLGVTIALCIMPKISLNSLGWHMSGAAFRNYVEGILGALGDPIFTSMVNTSPAMRPAAQDVIDAAKKALQRVDCDTLGKNLADLVDTREIHTTSEAPNDSNPEPVL